MADPPDPGRDDQTPFSQEVGARAERKAQALRHPPGVWFGLGMMGLIGWSVVVPTLLGAGLGIWLDRGHPGRISWTLSLLLLGLVLGCANAWHWMSKEDRAMHADDGDDDHKQEKPKNG